MTTVRSIDELADAIHQHQTEDYACYFRLAHDVKSQDLSSIYKVLVVADEGNFVLIIRQEDGENRMAFRLLTQPTSVGVYKCILMYFYHYLRLEPTAVVAADTIEELNCLASSISKSG